jgi:Leucine-rich repeat (LRR) protein
MHNICPQLVPLYTQWKSSLDQLSQAILKFTESGSDEDHQSILDLQNQVKAAQEAYTREAYGTFVDYRDLRLCVLEAMIVQVIDQRLKEGGGNQVVFKVQSERVVKISASENQSTTINTIFPLLQHLHSLTHLYLDGTQVSKIENLPDSLTVLDLGGTQVKEIENLPDSLTVLDLRRTQVKEIENLPDSLTHLNLNGTQVKKIENLPDSLRWFDLGGTPAAEDPEQIAVLEAFKQTHPGFNYHI